jgi:hypothetical protein
MIESLVVASFPELIAFLLVEGSFGSSYSGLRGSLSLGEFPG